YMGGLVIASVIDYAGRKHFVLSIMDDCNYLQGRQLRRFVRDFRYADYAFLCRRVFAGWPPGSVVSLTFSNFSSVVGRQAAAVSRCEARPNMMGPMLVVGSQWLVLTGAFVICHWSLVIGHLRWLVVGSICG